MGYMAQTLISLSSFGAAEVRRHGQPWFARFAREAGADAVEVRGELLRDAASELPAMQGLAAVYSSPEGLWAEGGWLDSAALARAIEAATLLGASKLKMSIGSFGPAAHGSLTGLRSQLAQTPIELLIENDQTLAAGSLPALADFFDACDRAGLSLGMTFDMGNWHWLGECPLQAAQTFARRVRYLHCKGVQRLPAKWVAVPLADSLAPWRAVLRALPAGLPRAIEYPLAGDDLLAVTREQLALMRSLP